MRLTFRKPSFEELCRSHGARELELMRWFERHQCAYIVGWTYHHALEEREVSLLRRGRNATALLARTVPDAIIIPYGRYDRVFFLEVKTSKSPFGFPIECFPLCSAVVDARYKGTRTLYVLSNPKRDGRKHWAFWADWLRDRAAQGDFAPVCLAPPKRPDVTAEVQRIGVSAFGSGFQVRCIDGTQGSNDPFLVIPYSLLDRLPEWDEVVLRWIVHGERIP